MKIGGGAGPRSSQVGVDRPPTDELKEPLIETAREDLIQFWAVNPPSGKVPIVSTPPWGLEIHA